MAVLVAPLPAALSMYTKNKIRPSTELLGIGRIKAPDPWKDQNIKDVIVIWGA